MKFNLDENSDSYSITGYADGWIRVGEQRLEVPCVVSPAGIVTDLLPARLSDLTIDHFHGICASAPVIILLGTGATQIFIDFSISRALAEQGVGLEIMDTAAACRSFNVLLAESRAVAAALYMI